MRTQDVVFYCSAIITCILACVGYYFKGRDEAKKASAAEATAKAQEAAAKTREQEAQNTMTRGLQLITDVIAAKRDADTARVALEQQMRGRADESTTREKLKVADSVLRGIDNHIQKALNEVPAEMAAKLKQQASMDDLERAAQGTAAELSAAIQPKVSRALDVIKATIERSKAPGLAHPKSIKVEAPPRLILSQYQVLSRSDQWAGDAMTVEFEDGRTWKVLWQFGWVKSPSEKVKGHPSSSIDDVDPSLIVTVLKNGKQTAGGGSIVFDRLTGEVRGGGQAVDPKQPSDERLTAWVIAMLKQDRLND